VQEGLVHGGAEPNGTDGSAAPQDAAWSDDCLLYRPNEHRKGKGAKAITSEQLDAFLTFMRATSAYITHTPPVKRTFHVSYFTIPYDFQSSGTPTVFQFFAPALLFSNFRRKRREPYTPAPSSRRRSDQNKMAMYVVKRDGRQEPVHFDKITARISKLAYGLNQEFCDPVRRSLKS
jgi:hypothetical protein